MLRAGFTKMVRSLGLGRRPGHQPDLIFDIGMHNGDDSAYYLGLGFRVVAVEANPVHVRAARRRFKREIRARRLTIVSLGIAATRGVLPFYVNPDIDVWSSFESSWAGRLPEQHLTTRLVRTITAEDLIERFGVPHYAKIDVEGMDHIVVQHLINCGARPRFISFELSFSQPNLPTLEVLLAAAYSRFKIVSQVEVPNRLQRAGHWPGGEWKFRFGSSGPFGDDADGEWLDAAQTRSMLTDLPDGFFNWHDLHAALA